MPRTFGKLHHMANVQIASELTFLILRYDLLFFHTYLSEIFRSLKNQMRFEKF